MSNLSSRFLQSKALVALGLSATVTAPLVVASPAAAQANFSDIRNHWAREFIEVLADENVIAGFPDGTFKPDAPVTRAQFAAIVRQAFDEPSVRAYRGFNDIPNNYWATPAIREAYESGFLSGYPGGVFDPNRQIPKAQVLVSLGSGLDLNPTGQPSAILNTFRDANAIPDYAVDRIAAATEKGLVVNYPNVNYLNPNETATRGDVAAFIYQALVNQGELQPLSTRDTGYQYIVRATGSNTGNNNTGNTGNNAGTNRFVVSSGTQIQVRLPGSDSARFFITPGETVAATLQVAESITGTDGRVVIPAGSSIQGRFQPVNIGGTPATQFFANTVTIDGRTYSLNAASSPVVASSNQNISTGTLRDGIATAAAQALLGEILGGSANVGNILSRVLGTNNPATTDNSLIVVDPRTDLRLTVQSDFSLTANTPTNPNPGNTGSSVQIASGTQVGLSYQGNSNAQIVLAPGETVPVTMQIPNTVVNSLGQVVIPAGSRVEGRFVPVTSGGLVGTRFVADRLIVGNTVYSVSANSAIVTAVSGQSINPANIQVGFATQAGQAALTNQGAVILVNPANLRLVFEQPVTLS